MKDAPRVASPKTTSVGCAKTRSPGKHGSPRHGGSLEETSVVDDQESNLSETKEEAMRGESEVAEWRHGQQRNGPVLEIWQEQQMEGGSQGEGKISGTSPREIFDELTIIQGNSQGWDSYPTEGGMESLRSTQRRKRDWRSTHASSYGAFLATPPAVLTGINGAGNGASLGQGPVDKEQTLLMIQEKNRQDRLLQQKLEAAGIQSAHGIGNGIVNGSGCASAPAAGRGIATQHPYTIPYETFKYFDQPALGAEAPKSGLYRTASGRGIGGNSPALRGHESQMKRSRTFRQRQASPINATSNACHAGGENGLPFMTAPSRKRKRHITTLDERRTFLCAVCGSVSLRNLVVSLHTSL